MSPPIALLNRHYKDKAEILSAGATSIPPVYGLKEFLDAVDEAGEDFKISAEDFRLIIRETFVLCLRKFGCDVIEEPSADKNQLFVKVRLRELPARRLAGHMDYNCQLHSSASSDLTIRHHLSYVPPSIPFDETAESLETGFYAAQNERPVWARFDLLNRLYIGSPSHCSRSTSSAEPEDLSRRAPTSRGGTIDDIYKEYPSLSVFRDIDRVRLLSYIISAHFDMGKLMQSSSLGIGRKMPATIITHFPVHKRSLQLALSNNWARFNRMWTTDQPWELIRNYFGENVAFYFLWTAYLSDSLRLPAAFGLIVFFVQLFADPSCQYHTNWLAAVTVGYAVYISIWSALIMIRWRSYEETWKVKWGMKTEKLSSKIERSSYIFDYYVVDSLNPKKLVKFYDPVKLKLRNFVSSFLSLGSLVTIIGCVVAIFTMRFVMTQEEELFEWSKGYESTLISTIQACQIIVFDYVWCALVKWLTTFENHMLETSYRRSFTFKMFLFRFCNNFYALLYIGFAKNYVDPCVKPEDNDLAGCLRYFRLQLGILHAFYGLLNLVEIGQPVFAYMGHRGISKTKFSSIERQEFLEGYSEASLIEDHMEIIIQFCSVVLFSVALPIIPALAYLVNLMEIRVDAFKLTTGHRRVFPQVAPDGIGICNDILGTVGLIALPFNVALCLFLIPLAPNMSLVTKLLVFVAVEHILILLRIYIEVSHPAGTPEADNMEELMETVVHHVIWGQGRGAESVVSKQQHSSFPSSELSANNNNPENNNNPSH